MPPRGPHSNGFLSLDSQVGVSKFSQLGLLGLWGHITSCANLQLQWGLKQSCSPCWEPSNGMLHSTFAQGNHVDSRLSVVESQTANLTHGLSFDHNLCFKCPNERCEPILDIYFSIAFQWYKELFKAMIFFSYNRALKNWKSIWNSNSYNDSSFGSVRVHSFTLCILENLQCDS
jgi:hypothetical protein